MTRAGVVLAAGIVFAVVLGVAALTVAVAGDAGAIHR